MDENKNITAFANQKRMKENPQYQNLLYQRNQAKSKINHLLKMGSIKTQAVGFIVILLISSGLYWASQAEIDETAMAQGMVIPSGKNKVVQHLEGGILSKILISEGDRVLQGQEIFHLDLGVTSLDKTRLEVELEALLIARDRARAEAAQTDQVQLHGQQREDLSDIIEAETKLFYSNKRVLQSGLNILNKRFEQKQSELFETKMLIENLHERAEGHASLHDILKKQYENGASSKSELLESQLTLTEITGRIQQAKQRIVRLKQEKEELNLTKRQEQEKYKIRALLDLDELERKIASIRKTLQRAGEQQGRSIVYSPTDGVIKSLRYNTVGNVIRSGEVLAEIVPIGNYLLIDAKLEPKDIGFVKVGQPAVIKLETYDFSRYGGIDGEIVLLSPSSVTSEDGITYFEIQVKPDKIYLGNREESLPISPGMIATVDVITGKRTVLEFLLKPVLKIRDEAFRER